MKQILGMIALLTITMALAGCGGTKTVELDQLAAEDVRPPDWYVNPPKDGDFLYAVATSTSMDVQVSVDKATLMCREELGKRIALKLRGIENNFEEETGFLMDAELKTAYKSAVNAITEQTLRGTRAKKKHLVHEGELWRAYILMELPVDQIQQEIITGVKGHEGLLDRLGETATFKEIGG
ncbi:MAG: hypothetical protein KOO63_14430 [Bacteroidales bacterium]|nr:hypothetical protein [Candidatus Latescibacterota bacterium]